MAFFSAARRYSVPTPSQRDDQSMLQLLFDLAKILLSLGWSLLLLAAPVVLVTMSPPLLGLVITLGAGGMTALTAWFGWKRVASFFSRVSGCAVFGLGLGLGLSLPNYWNVFAAFIVIAGGLVALGALCEKLGVSTVDVGKPDEEGKTAAGLYETHDTRGARSAWGGQELDVTPEGQPIRLFNMGEIAMGGPVYFDYLFPDGVLLQGIGSSAQFSTDGRYFAAPVPSRNQWGLIVLDRHMRRTYQCENDHLWELDEFTSTELRGRVSPLVDNGASAISLQAMLKASSMTQLEPVGDIWVDPALLEHHLASATVQHIGPHKRHCIDGKLVMPESLRELEQPLDALRYPVYELSLDDRESPLYFYADAPVVWRDDGKALSIVARHHDDKEARYWVWQPDAGWHSLPTPWVVGDNDLSLSWNEPLSLDAEHLRIGGYLAFANPDRGMYGYGLRCVHGDTQIQTGHDAQGCLQASDRKLTKVRLVVPLTGDGERGMSSIESEPLLNRTRACLTWQMDNHAGTGGYRCRIEDWEMPGLWLLDHRVSDCGRYLALIPFTEHPASAGKVVVVDALKRQRLDGPAMEVVNLLDFRSGSLMVTLVLGRLKEGTASSPLKRFDIPAPPIGNAASFCDYREESRPYYRMVELRVGEDGVRVAPQWRVVEQPQAANADGDFVQPAADGSDAAWLFGTETEYADSWLRAESGRLGGHLLTASGCVLNDLAPSMCWSPDARYLALTRLHEDMQRNWELLLLDVHARTLRTWNYPTGNRPQFEGFDNGKLRVRTFEHDFASDRYPDKGRVMSIKLDDWLALPVEQLVERDGLWLLAAQQTDAPLWQALDKMPLQPWLRTIPDD